MAREYCKDFYSEEVKAMSEAIIRETYEEVGLIIEPVRPIGIYSLPSYKHGNHTILFLATSFRGELKLQESEVIAADYFYPTQLPQPLIWWHHQRILDAFLKNEAIIVRSQNVYWPFDASMTREELYKLRDRSGMSRQEFFLYYFSIDSSSE